MIRGAGSLLVFVLIAVFVFTDLGGALSLDIQALLSIYNTNLGGAFLTVSVLSSQYGRGFFWVLMICIMLLFGKPNTKLMALELSILFVMGVVVGDALKIVLVRARSFGAVSGIVLRLPPQGLDSSFPSGHALIVSIGAFFALVRFNKSWKTWTVSILLVIEAAIFSFARLYLGVHYPSDVLASVFLAACMIFVGVCFLERPLARLVRWGTKIIERILVGFLRIPQFLYGEEIPTPCYGFLKGFDLY